MESKTSITSVNCMYGVQSYMDYTFDIPLPQTMYSTDNVHHSVLRSEEQDNKNSSSTENPCGAKVTNDLEKRQDCILQMLESMKQEIAALAHRVGFTFKVMTPKAEVAKVTKASELRKIKLPEQFDMVISSDPANPPVIAFLFYHLLKTKDYQISSPSHTHSSAQSRLDSKWEKCINSRSPLSQERKELIMTFIWRSDPFGPSLKVSPNLDTSIKGSNNIARFLARQFEPSLYEDCGHDNTALIDSWLDGAILQITHGSSKEKAAGLRSMNSHLGGSDWLVDGQMTIADLCAWSSLVAEAMFSLDSLPKNVKRWFNQCLKCQPFRALAEALQF